MRPTQIHDEPRPVGCPHCGTRVRGDVPWCLGCYEPLDAGPAGDAEASDAARPPQDAPHRAVVGLVSHPARPDGLDAVATRLLAELAATRDEPGWASRLPGTPAGRTALVAGLVTAGCGVLLAAMALVGLAL